MRYINLRFTDLLTRFTYLEKKLDEMSVLLHSHTVYYRLKVNYRKKRKSPYNFVNKK